VKCLYGYAQPARVILIKDGIRRTFKHNEGKGHDKKQKPDTSYNYHENTGDKYEIRDEIPEPKQSVLSSMVRLSNVNV